MDNLKLPSFFQVDVVNRTAHADLTNYTPNGEWTLAESPSLIRRVKTYSNLPEPFPEIVITFHIRRKTLYYMYNIGKKGPVQLIPVFLLEWCIYRILYFCSFSMYDDEHFDCVSLLPTSRFGRENRPRGDSSTCIFRLHAGHCGKNARNFWIHSSNWWDFCRTFSRSLIVIFYSVYFPLVHYVNWCTTLIFRCLSHRSDGDHLCFGNYDSHSAQFFLPRANFNSCSSLGSNVSTKSLNRTLHATVFH